MPREVTKAAFARSVGSTPPEVSRQLRRGLPVTPEGKIPLADGRAWWAANRQTRVNTQGQDLPVRLYTSARAQKMAHDARKAAADAERAELELAVRQGELVGLTEVRKAWFTILRMTRDRMQAITERSCGPLAAEDDPAKVRAYLTKEVNDALTALVSDLRYEPEPDAEEGGAEG